MASNTRSSSRKRSAEDNTDNYNPPKQPKMSQLDKLVEAMTRIESKIDATAKSVEDKASALESKLESACNKIKDEFQAELTKFKYSIDFSVKQQITEIKSNFETATKKINDEINLLRANTNVSTPQPANADDFDRMMLINDLKIIGVPYNDIENLTDIFIKIAVAIGYDTTQPIAIPQMRRIINRSRIANQVFNTKVITMRFIALHIKEQFYGLYLNTIKNKPLSLKDIGFADNSRVIIGEQLTSTNQKIFREASNYKRSNRSMQVFTTNGQVKIRLQKGGTTYIIKNQRELDELAKSSNLNAPITYSNQIPITNSFIQTIQPISIDTQTLTGNFNGQNSINTSADPMDTSTNSTITNT